MLDLKWIRESPEAFDRALERRGQEAASAQVLELDRQHREALTELQEVQTRRNEASKAIGEAKRAGAGADDLIAEVAGLKDRMAELEGEERRLSGAL